MGVKFNRRIKLAKGVNLNIGKKGVNSISFKVGKTTINPTKNTFSYNSSIKGVSYQGKLVGTNDTKKANGNIDNNIDTVNNINSVNSCSSIKRITDLNFKDLLTLVNCIQNYKDIIRGSEENIIQFNNSIENNRKLNEEAIAHIMDIEKDTEIPTEEKERLINIIRTEGINKGVENINKCKDNISLANETIEKAKKGIEEIELTWGMSVKEIMDYYIKYDRNNIYNNSNNNVIKEAEEILGINNNKGLKNDTEGTIFAIILIGIIFLFVAIMCS